MKKFLLLFVGLILATAAIAEVTVYDNGTQLGRVDKINIKGGTNSKSGQYAIIDLRSLAGVNWQAVTGISSSAVNWANVVDAQLAGAGGVNWYIISPNNGGGVNWYRAANGATATNIVCWKSNGQLGKCTTGVTGANCTSCQ